MPWPAAREGSMGGLRWPRRPFQVICVAVVLALTAGFSQQSGLASHPGARPIPDKPNLGSLGERLNTNTIAIVSGNPNATYLNIAYDLSDVLDDGDNFRILPVIGKGGGQNVRDVRFLKGIDLGITQSIILNEYRESNEIGSIDDKIVYVAKLFNEEMHVVVRADSGITSLEQLSGKKVNFSDVGSGSQLSTRDIFKRLGIQAQEVNMGQGDALERLKAGELAATILIAGKPAGAVGKLKAADGLRFLQVPFAKPLQADYLPAVLGHADYPGMVEDGHDVNTIAVSAVLIAYNWPRDSDRYRRIANFVAVFFPKLAALQKPPHHPKWRETNLAAVLPGWTRFPAAQEWLDQNRPSETANAATREQFDQFLAAQRPAGTADVSADQREQLFQEFLKWQARERP
jgi:TRAP transporter TAXI family solute receptor